MSKNIATCKLCGEKRQLVRAHVVPQSFHSAACGDDGYMFVAPADPRDGYIRRSHSGEYDRYILCADCESLFSPWDSYAKSFLIDRDWSTCDRVEHDRGEVLIEPVYDYRKLKLFFLATLWRAAVSGREVYESVQLGPHEATLGDRIRRGDPGGEQDFAVVLQCLTASDAHPELDPSAAWLSPDRIRHGELNFMRVPMAEWTALVKVDSRPVPHPVRRVILSEGRPLVVFTRPLTTSAAFKHMIAIARKHQ